VCDISYISHTHHTYFVHNQIEYKYMYLDALDLAEHEMDDDTIAIHLVRVSLHILHIVYPC
jgi:hypothetical protein